MKSTEAVQEFGIGHFITEAHLYPVSKIRKDHKIFRRMPRILQYTVLLKALLKTLNYRD